MPITPELLLRAQSKDRAAMIKILSLRYPCLYRMAYALTGRDDAAASVVAIVLRKSVVALRQWEQPPDVIRWFMHHTLLSVRRGRHCSWDLSSDPLIKKMATTNAYYPAFIQALRALPMQQREAYLLHHGEQLDERALGVAMDCSVQAARLHLREATHVLSTYAGVMFPTMTAQVTQAYGSLVPPSEMIEPAIRADLRRGGWGKRLLRGIVRLMQACALLLFAWFLWKIIPMLRW